MTTAQTINTQAALATLGPARDKLGTALFLARKGGILRNSEFAISQLQSAAGELLEITQRTLRNEPDGERVSRKLMVVAGMFSDIQEYYFVEYDPDEDGQECDMGGSLLPTEVNDLLNSIKSDIFDVIDMVNPRY